MSKVVQLKQTETVADKLIALTSKLDSQTWDTIRKYAVLEAQIMLGLTGLDEEEIDKIEPMLFDDMWAVWQEANSQCYFCSDEADPNEEEFGDQRTACIICEMKLRSLLKKGGLSNLEAERVIRRASK